MKSKFKSMCKNLTNLQLTEAEASPKSVDIFHLEKLIDELMYKSMTVATEGARNPYNEKALDEMNLARKHILDFFRQVNV